MEEDFKVKQTIKKEIQRLDLHKIKLEKASWIPINKELELVDSIDITIITLLKIYAYIDTGNTSLKDEDAQILLESIL